VSGGLGLNIRMTTMKWFKHLTRSKSDPDIMESELKFKSNGPYVFWRLLEILGDENAINTPLIINFKVFKMWFPSITVRKLVEVLTYFQHKSRIIFKLVDEEIQISCIKLGDISSDYVDKVRRTSKQSSDTVKKSIPLEVEEEEEVEVEEEKKKKKKDIKHIYGEYSHVLLSDEQLEKLKVKFTDYKNKIKNLDEYIQMKGAKYKDHYLTILKWSEKDKPKKPSGQYEEKISIPRLTIPGIII
jgi:hypothetical protein